MTEAEMARLKKGSPAAKAWGRRMHALRGGKKKKAKKKVAKRRAAPKRRVGRQKVVIGGIAYEPTAARKARGKKKAKKKKRGRKAALPYGYGYC